MQLLFDIFYQYMDSFSFLILSAIGLAIIFGMMRIINLAHGEFIMLGAYISTYLTFSNVPMWLAIILGAIGVGVFAYIVDVLIISRLYGRTLDSIVVTWGISLVMSQGMLILFGPSLQGASMPLGSITIGTGNYAVYRIVLFVITLVLVFLLYWIFMHTKFGLHSRATMQNYTIANSLGVNTSRIYSVTFMLGAAFAGLVGGLYAPTMTISPLFGNNFLVPSFVTVIVGGANPLIGTVLSGGFLGIINSALAFLFGTFIGRVGLLVFTILVIRLLPLGFSGLVEKKQMRGVK